MNLQYFRELYHKSETYDEIYEDEYHKKLDRIQPPSKKIRQIVKNKYPKFYKSLVDMARIDYEKGEFEKIYDELTVEETLYYIMGDLEFTLIENEIIILDLRDWSIDYWPDLSEMRNLFELFISPRKSTTWIRLPDSLVFFEILSPQLFQECPDIGHLKHLKRIVAHFDGLDYTKCKFYKKLGGQIEIFDTERIS